MLGRRDGEGARREEQRGAARHPARQAAGAPHDRRPLLAARTSPCGSWCRRHDRRRPRAPTDPRLEPPTWHGDELSRRGARPGHRPGARQHGRPRRLLPMAAAAGPRRQPRAVRPAARRRAVQRRAGARVLVDVPGRPPSSGPRRAARPPPPPGRRRVHPDLQRGRSTSSSRPSSPPTRMRGARVRVAVLDDGDRDEMERMAMRHGVRYVRRRQHDGAKAGNINHALGRTDAPFVLVLDCDHVPYPEMLERLLPEFVDPRVAYVQSPQYYANHGVNRLAGAAWSQQALFFGPIARGKDAHRSMICCGTNVVFRRAGARRRRRLPAGLADRGLRPVDRPPRAALGVGVRARAARLRLRSRGPRRLRQPAAPLGARLPRRDPRRAEGPAAAAQEAAVPAVGVVLPLRVDGGPVPRAADDPHPDRHPAARRLAGRHVPRRLRARTSRCRWPRSPASAPGRYTFAAYSLATSSFWLHVHATISVLRRRVGSFVVTPEGGRLAAPAAAGGAGAGRDRASSLTVGRRRPAAQPRRGDAQQRGLRRPPRVGAHPRHPRRRRARPRDDVGDRARGRRRRRGLRP